MRCRPPSVRMLSVATAAALAAGGVGIATGAIPDSSGKVTACYTKIGGVMRVVDTEKSPPQHCVAGLETQLVLNQKGPAGPTGPKGDPGAKGDNGDPGPAGTSGQSAKTVYGAPLTLNSTSNDTPIPGLTQTVTVPDGAVVSIATDGGLSYRNPSTTDTQATFPIVFVTIDGNSVRFQQLCLTTLVGQRVYQSWSLSSAHALSPGVHHISVEARLEENGPVDINTFGQESALTVTVLKN